MLTALQNDDKRRVVQLSLTGCCKFDYFQLRGFLQHLPPQLQVLRLDLGFTAVQLVELDARLPELQELSLRMVKMPLRQVTLQRSMLPKLRLSVTNSRSLHLWLSTLPELEELPLDIDILRLQELVLHVHNCPKLPKNTKQALYDTVHPWPWHNADKWISIDEAEPSWFQLFQRGDAVYAASPAVVKSTEAATATFQDVSASSDMPFPCSHAKCTEFHDNTHGYCQKHRWSPIWMKASCRVIKTCQWLELIFLLTIQAAAEIQSRLLLVLMIFSLLPATCIFLEHSTGMSVASACVTCLVVALGSCFYSAKRLDAMQQSVFRLAIATEAHYFQVLEARANTGQHLVQVSTMLANHSGASSKVLQTEKDLKTNYFQAKRHRSLFQTSVSDPLARIGLEVAAKIKPLTELDEKEGAVDVLHCEVVCESLQQVQLAWEGLKRLDVEIVSTQDFFAVTSSTKCLKIVVSLQGYLATVCLLEKSLSSLEAQRGISEVANSLGLLDKTAAATWEVWYRHYFGVQGCHYAFKVAALQFLTVLMQGIAKASLFRTIQDTYGPEVLQGNTAVQCFMVLLLCNIMFAAMILASPNSIVSRVVAALLDAVLDVGYLVTSIWMYVGFASEYLEDIFLHSAGCTHFESLEEDALRNVLRFCFDGFCWHSAWRCIIPTGYVALAAADVLEFNLTHRNITQVLPDAFLARGVHKSVRYVSLRGNHLTELPDRLFRDLLQVEHAEHEWDMETVDLSHNRLTVLPPRIFQAGSVRELPWIHELHLESNRLTTLPAGVFAGLTVKQLYLQSNNLTQLHPDSFRGLKLLDYGILDVSRNKLQTLPSRVFEGLEVEQVYLQDNDLTTLPGGVFADLTVKQLYLQSNNLTQLHPDSFRGLKLLDYGILDVSRNKLQTLPSRVFEGLEVEQVYLQDNDLTTLPGGVFADLTVKQLYLQSNNLTQLHPDSFRGLKLLDYGILDVSRNKLQTLPPYVFAGLYVKQLHLQSNNLTQLHETSFRGLKFPYSNINSILDISQNKLQTVSPYVFIGLEVAQLYLQNNKLQALPGVFTWGLASYDLKNLRVLNLAHNELSEVPQFDRFDNLRCLKLEGNRLQRLHQKTFRGWHYDDSSTYLDRGMPLEDLNLEQNQLTELHPDCFVYYSQLRENLLELKLGGNRLTALPDGLFNGRQGLSKLRTLQLQSNRLVRLPQKIFQNLPRLQSLNLSQNKLDELPPGLFDGLNLTIIDLSHNNLTVVDAKLFHLENLTTLDLRGNRLTDTTRQDLARLKVELHVD
ncbi:unnamed protein product [Cladocopium goreaui]|uniref:Uncharacterized protein n=1 Tax=Cladocopium goreaui TaxID=2562237 RepID=A0A9P1BU68_9DINO|nr:unnamed protein product [Cladocopium goreaui]